MEKNWTPKLVAESFEEAVLTLKKLPSVVVKGYLSTMSEIVHTLEELSEMKCEPMRILPSPTSISRADKVITWIKWIDVKERKIVWRRAARLPWRYICNEVGLSRTCAWLRWKKALCVICLELNKQGLPEDYWRGFSK